jgi:hypothetical protein
METLRLPTELWRLILEGQAGDMKVHMEPKRLTTEHWRYTLKPLRFNL